MSPLRILLVDDSELVLMVLSELFITYGNEVASALSGAEALEKLSAEKFDCIISDYHMPSMDGLELLKRVRERDRKIVFLLMTGTWSEEIEKEALDLGADGVISKPIDFNEILAKVQSHL
jgi:CheY-like chemotaxis protein